MKVESRGEEEVVAVGGAAAQVKAISRKKLGNTLKTEKESYLHNTTTTGFWGAAFLTTEKFAEPRLWIFVMCGK